MDLVRTRDELGANIDQLAAYLESADATEREFALGLIKRGICFVVTRRNDELFFSPSRFVGYVGNRRALHEANPEKDGRVTNPAISKVLNAEPTQDALLNEEYRKFCLRIGLEPVRSGSFGLRRKFWDAG